jgi:alkylation response protein AidB-like acyl-CoA dehydrogenase
MPEFSFEPVELPPTAPALRERVRQFLALERSRNTFDPVRNSWTSFNAEFSRRCGEEGLIGLVFPREYGGQGMSNLERYVVMEELIAGGALTGLRTARAACKSCAMGPSTRAS